MATIKSYTDISQSKILAEILPHESADMRWGHITPYDFSDRMYDGGYDKVPYPKDFLKLCADFCEEDIYDGSLPCWSLASLLGLLPFPVLYMEMVAGMIFWCCECHFIETDEVVKIEHYDNPVDACVAMVEKLHELKML